jgi:DNA polymerase
MIEPFEDLEEEINSCTACQLHESSTYKVIMKGGQNPKVLFIGEAPGKNEDASGIPFCGRAGKILDGMIEDMDIQQNDWAVINTVKCRPPDNRRPRKGELAACRAFFERQIEILDPDVIILLGNTAEEAFFGKRQLQWGECREIDGKNVVKFYHPAALIYTKSRQPEQQEFIEKNSALW